ncbi:hypothetical protein LT493_31490 [Streptomyces tricolor]|nr:hypothetical protein [Streptomyces tricolor]
MCADLGTAERVAVLRAAERAALTSARRPIVLLRRRTPSRTASFLAGQVSPGQPAHRPAAALHPRAHPRCSGCPAIRPAPECWS